MKEARIHSLVGSLAFGAVIVFTVTWHYLVWQVLTIAALTGIALGAASQQAKTIAELGINSLVQQARIQERERIYTGLRHKDAAVFHEVYSTEPAPSPDMSKL